MSTSSHPPAFRKILVANRGEIACRVFRTAREMGLATVAVFSDAEAEALHVNSADEAVRIGAARSSDSYLNQEAVLSAAKRTGADAIHPGYGFLAENPEFADKCADQGVVFIGPSSAAIRLMGDKNAARELAQQLSVPVLPGLDLTKLSAEEIHEGAQELGFPLLVKAAAGGGGKGMQVVRSVAELDEALVVAGRQAEAAFADSSLLLEKLLTSARHIEIQVFADHHGNVVHLFERDCSVQRRHQKVFEESPCVALAAATRERLAQAAVTLARAVEYRGAGTVEFLVEPSGAFYFLEMNTRLQVEHPVTELVTGIDLVRLQIEVAQGRELEFEQADVTTQGHAIEARLYAEDASRDFLPATGRIRLWRQPDQPGVRIDSGVSLGSEVGLFYDPMLAKVIAHGKDRQEALLRLSRGLRELAVGGLPTNRAFLLWVLTQPAFVTGECGIDFLKQVFCSETDLGVDLEVQRRHAIAATLVEFHHRRSTPNPLPRGVLSGWRNNRWRPQVQRLFLLRASGEAVSKRFEIAVHYVAESQGTFSMAAVLGEAPEETSPDLLIAVRLVSASDDGLVLEIDGRRLRFYTSSGGEETLTVHGEGYVSEFELESRFPRKRSVESEGACTAPMTGMVLEVRAATGSSVTTGQTLVVLEAMKMEHQLKAQCDGVLETVGVKVGQMVDPDEVVFVVRPSSK